MTLPRERTNSLRMARDFLESLLNPTLTPRVPKDIRRQAYWCLRHFPHDREIEMATKALPRVFGAIEGD
jgi:hypothetical protein